jgi:hypothetical protein
MSLAVLAVTQLGDFLSDSSEFERIERMLVKACHCDYYSDSVCGRKRNVRGYVQRAIGLDIVADGGYYSVELRDEFSKERRHGISYQNETITACGYDYRSTVVSPSANSEDLY